MRNSADCWKFGPRPRRSLIVSGAHIGRSWMELRVPPGRFLLLMPALLAIGLAGFFADGASAAPCDPPIANAIVCENSQPGNPPSEWDVSGAGDATIQGFATDISVNQGQTVHFKINTPSSNYHIDIYRIGYYGGHRRAQGRDRPPSATAAADQPACLTDAATGLIDCGNWAVSASWAVPADAVSGIYFAKLDARRHRRREPHRLRRPRRREPLRHPVPDLGHHLAGLQPVRRQQPLRRRPGTDPAAPTRSATTARSPPAAPSPEDWVVQRRVPDGPLARAQRLRRQLHHRRRHRPPRRRAARDHKVFLSVGHDEYWSGAQRANVEAARAAGVNLAFFSGNEIFWKTRWETSIDGSQHRLPHAGLLQGDARQREDRSAGPPTLDRHLARPALQPAGRRRPARERADRHALHGQLPAPTAITVPGGRRQAALLAQHDASPRSRRADRDAARPSTLGYEWDEDARQRLPAGRPDPTCRRPRSATSPRSCWTTARPTAPGTATHSLTLYRAPSGALVFGAGTVQWSWGLDGDHDRGATPRRRRGCSRRRSTCFADMGAQPATLQSGLVAGDASRPTRRAPTSTITSPAAGAQRRAAARTVTITGTATDDGRRRRSAASRSRVDGGTTWHPAHGPRQLDATPGRRPRSARRRSGPAPSTTAATSRRPAPAVDRRRRSSGACPCSIWDSSRVTGRRNETTQRGRDSASSSAPTSPATSPASASTRAPGNTGTHIGNLWTAAAPCWPPRPSPARRRRAGSRSTSPPRSRSPRTPPTSPRITPPTATTPRIGQLLRAGRRRQPAAARARPTGSTAATASTKYGATGSCSPAVASTVPGHRELSGRRRLRTRGTRTGHDPADDRPPALPAERRRDPSPIATDVTATFSEAMNPATIIGARRSNCAARSNALVAATVDLRHGDPPDHAGPEHDRSRCRPRPRTRRRSKAARRGHRPRRQPAGRRRDLVVHDRARRRRPRPTKGPGGPILVDLQRRQPVQPLLRRDPPRRGPERVRGHRHLERERRRCSTPTTSRSSARWRCQRRAGHDARQLGPAGRQPDRDAPRHEARGAARPEPPAARSANAYLQVDTATRSRQPASSARRSSSTARPTATRPAAPRRSRRSTRTPTTATANPAVTLRSVGTNGGQAAAFTYDLARSVVYTRQGNPAWAGQERDGVGADPLRRPLLRRQGRRHPAGLGRPEQGRDPAGRRAAAAAREPDRADEPRPQAAAALLVPAARREGRGRDDRRRPRQRRAPAGRFDIYEADSPPGCVVADWECVRSTSYIYPNTPLTNAQAAAYEAAGFEIALHAVDQLRRLGRARSAARRSVLHEPAAGLRVELSRASPRRSPTAPTASPGATGPPSRRSSSRTGSASTPTTTTGRRRGSRTGPACSPAPACRCASPTTTARSIDVYQATTQMTDESGQTYPVHDRHAARTTRSARRATTASSPPTCTPTTATPPAPTRSSPRRRHAACRSSRRARC